MGEEVSRAEFAALQAKVVRLEQYLASVLPEPARSEFYRANSVMTAKAAQVPPPAPERTVLDVYAISQRFGPTTGLTQTREVLEARNLALGLEMGGTSILESNLQALRVLKEARDAGQNWQTALLTAGLPVPDEARIAEEARVVRAKMAGLLVVFLAVWEQAQIKRSRWNPMALQLVRTGMADVLEATS